MLSRILTSAKRLLNPVPQFENNHQRAGGASISVDMVTTRRKGKTAGDGVDAEDSITVETPRSSRKRQRKPEDGDMLQVDMRSTGSAVRKQEDLPVRVKEDETPNRRKRVVVEIPASKAQRGINGNINSTPKSSLSAPDVIEIGNSDGSAEGLEESSDENNTSKPNNDSSQLDKNKNTLEKSNMTVKKQNKAGETGTIPTTTASKPKHKRFGSEEPEAEFFSTAVENIDLDDESSDDDAGPEVIGAQAAQRSVKMKARDATEAVKQQETIIRQKRKDRDAILKKQATASNRKRKRHTAERQEPQSVHSFPADSTPRIFPAGSVPALLPEEYLQDDEPAAATFSDDELRVKKGKKTKFADLVEKKPKDRRKGSTTYRVSEALSTKLAPKAAFNARLTKESWLQGRPGKLLATNRRPFSNSFSKSR